MRKILVLLTMLAVVLSLASCDTVKDGFDGFIDKITGGGEEHVHDYALTECTATCEEDGENIFTCSCGDSYTEAVVATGHDMQKTDECVVPNCTRNGKDCFKCTRCGKSEVTLLRALGHVYGVPSEPSRFAFCSREGCKASTPDFPKGGKLTETLAFNFTKEHEDAIDAKYNEVLALVKAAAEYIPDEHGFAEEGALADEYAAVDAKHTELYDLVLYAVAQRQIAEIEYYCNMSNTEAKDTYSYMMEYYTAVIAKFYSLSQPFYDSCYREFYYQGMSEEEIKAFLLDSNSLLDPEYAELRNRNDEIELLFYDMEDPETDADYPVLYAEFVANNNRMAQIMGYDNYIEYAYENVYSREYSYEQVAQITEYFKQYLGQIYLDSYTQYIDDMTSGDMSRADEALFASQMEESFFKNSQSNETLNNYIDVMAFNENALKQIAFSDVFNDLMSDGNLYRGNYAGAFVTYFAAFETPVAYFGSGYDNPFTVVHEFGHYMNEIYNESEYEQSYDLLEMHSQGNEMIYLNHLKGEISSSAYKILENYQILVMLNVTANALAVDYFEQSVYLNHYEGYGSEYIMADEKITSDEYDELFKCILRDMGISQYGMNEYWRLVTISSPCYYVSYATSALSVLQLHEVANTQSFETARDAYLKLFTYTDTNPEMTAEEVLIFAGLKSFTDESMYVNLAEFLK